MRGVYQDKSNARTSIHQVKLIFKSPMFQEIDLYAQFYRDNAELRIDLKVLYVC